MQTVKEVNPCASELASCLSRYFGGAGRVTFQRARQQQGQMDRLIQQTVKQQSARIGRAAIGLINIIYNLARYEQIVRSKLLPRTAA